MARPMKFSSDLAAKIVQLVKVGNYPGVAAAAAGVSKATFYRWKARGEQQKRGRFREFCDALTHAIAEAEASHVTILRLAAQGTETRHGDWRAAAHYLERRKPRRWGRRDHLNMRHAVVTPPPPQRKADLSVLTDEELDVYEGILTKLAASEQPADAIQSDRAVDAGHRLLLAASGQRSGATEADDDVLVI